MPKALVIAGTSFIGRHVCDHLRALGCEVVATSRRKEAADRGETVFCELTDPASVENAIRDAAPDWIIQCGGATSSRDPDELLRTHVDGTCNVLAAARVYAHDASVCIFGSAAEYGPVAERYLPVSEECVWQPTTPFGQSKLAQTHLALAAAASTRQKIVIVRPFNVVGPGLPDFYFAGSRRTVRHQELSSRSSTRTQRATSLMHVTWPPLLPLCSVASISQRLTDQVSRPVRYLIWRPESKRRLSKSRRCWANWQVATRQRRLARLNLAVALFARSATLRDFARCACHRASPGRLSFHGGKASATCGRQWSHRAEP
jgi:NAD(P)-dependent dehydrogenase (short-subunit alcohol dehydrogenase family)